MLDLVVFSEIERDRPQRINIKTLDFKTAVWNIIS